MAAVFHSLPLELVKLILWHFDPESHVDRANLCSLVRVNRAFHSLAIPRLYSHANIRAMVTLLRNPAYVAYVQTVSLRWTPEGHNPIGLQGELSDTSEEEDDEDEDENNYIHGDDSKTFRLRSCSKTTLATVLLNMLPSLRHLYIPFAELGNALWAAFPRRTPPPNRRFMLPLGLQHVRSLHVDLENTTKITLYILVRFFCLPQVTALCISWLDDSEYREIWPDDHLDFGYLHQTSNVAHLSLESSSVGRKLLSCLLQLPRALCSLEYSIEGTYSHTYNLGSISPALRHVAGTLQHLSIIDSAIHTWGPLTSLPDLTALRTVSLLATLLESQELLEIPPLSCLMVALSPLYDERRQLELASVLDVLVASDVAQLILIGSQLEATQVPSEMHRLCKSKGVMLEFISREDPENYLRAQMLLRRIHATPI